MSRIPIKVAEQIAQKYQYEQVIIIARKTGVGGRESVVTYGVTPTHCGVAAKIGEFLKFKIMGWPK